MSQGLYNAIVMDHFLHPRNVGQIPNASAVVEVTAPGCGDVLRLSLKIAGDVIEEARFQAMGCAAAIASSSMATVLLQGRTLGQAQLFSNRELVEALGGLPPEKIQCSVLAEQAVQAALASFLGHDRAGDISGRGASHKP